MKVQNTLRLQLLESTEYTDTTDTQAYRIHQDYQYISQQNTLRLHQHRPSSYAEPTAYIETIANPAYSIPRYNRHKSLHPETTAYNKT